MRDRRRRPSSNQQNPTHAYSAGGTYEVSLTVANLSGTSTWRTAITVAPHPRLPVVVLDEPSITTTSPAGVATTWHPSTTAGEVLGYEAEVQEIGSNRRAEWSSRSMTTTETTCSCWLAPGRRTASA